MQFHRVGFFIMAVSAAFAVHAADNAPQGIASQHLGSIERGEAKQATALLDLAVDYLRKSGPEKSLSAFNDRNGGFVRNEYYVFMLGLDGILVASGGEPKWEIGSNVRDLHDAAGKYFVRDMLAQAKTNESGTVEYRWLNRIDNRLEVKTTQFRKVGNYLVCVGYYIPRASAEEAATMLNQAVALLRHSDAKTAFSTFNDPHGHYVVNDRYVFAIGLDDGKYRASGAAPTLTGTDAREITDAAGKPLVKEMIALASQTGYGTVDYLWRNPATNGVEQKHTMIRRVDDVILGVGYYTKN
jgi:cytochrome c